MPTEISILDYRVAGLRFARGLGLLHTLAAETPVERALSALLRTDAQTHRPVLTVPLPESFATERLARVVSGLLNKLAGVS